MLPILKPRNRSTWRARVARAQQLAESSSSAGEVLSFYARILEFQQSIHADYQKEVIVPAGDTLRDCIDVERAAKVLPALIALAGWLWVFGTSPILALQYGSASLVLGVVVFLLWDQRSAKARHEPLPLE